ncbi:MAG: hypothetical protein Aureis2KO_01990 [Aureisphaera sp.]
MKKALLPLAILALSFTAVAQTPCVGGMAGTYPCNGYDLMSFIPWTTFGASNANDSWGWTDPQDGKEYAIVGVNNGVAFVDISDPVSPVYLGKLPTHTDSSLWRDVKVYDHYALVVSEAPGHGMQVFDLTRLRNVTSAPETFTEDAHYGGFGDAHNLVVNESEAYAYGVGTSTYGGGPHFIDLSDPLNPVGAGGYSVSGYSHDGQVITYNGPDADYTGKEIYIGSNTNEVVIADITDKSNPVTIATIGYSNISYTHQGWMTDDHTYFILGDEIDELDFGFNTRTVIFDFTDLDNPQHHFDYSGPTSATDHNGYVKGDRFYLANYKAGLRVVDISDIENGNMSEIGYFDIYPNNDTAGYDGAWNVYPYFGSGNILLTSLQYADASYLGGMHIIRESSLGTEEQVLESQLALYPNPAQNSITVQTQNAGINSIAVYDVLGQQLIQKTTSGNTTETLNISSLSTGIYYVNINNQTTKKIVKQ